MRELVDPFVMEYIYWQTEGSAGVLRTWREEAGTLVKPRNLDVPDFRHFLFGLPGWTISHTCHPVYAELLRWQCQAAFLIISC